MLPWREMELFNPLIPQPFNSSTINFLTNNSSTLQLLNLVTPQPLNSLALQHLNPATPQPYNSSTLQLLNPAAIQP